MAKILRFWSGKRSVLISFQPRWTNEVHASQTENNQVRHRRRGPRAVHDLCGHVKQAYMKDF